MKCGTRPRIVLSLIVAALLLACGGTQRQLAAAAEALRATREGIATWSDLEQAAIVRAATSEEEGLAALAAHVERRNRAVELVVVAHAALALAMTEPSAANVAVAAVAVAQAVKAVEALREGDSP